MLFPSKDKMFQSVYETGTNPKRCSVCGYSTHCGVIWIIHLEEYLCSFCIDWIVKGCHK